MTTTLGEIGRYHNGRAFKPTEWADQGRPIIRIQDLTGSGSTPHYFDGLVDPRHEVMPGELLISWSATLGAYIWQGLPAVLNQHTFKVESFVDKRFHFYAAQAVIADLYAKSHGSGMVHVTKGKFEETPVPLPPLPEQRRIVETLETHFTRLDAAVATLERVRANLKRYRAAVLAVATQPHEAPADWRLLPIEQLASKEPRSIQSGPFGSTLRHSEFRNTGRLVIGIDNVQDGYFSPGAQNRITEEKFAELERYEARPLDLLITVMATVGRCCLVPEIIERAIVTKHVYRITLDRALIDPKFALLALRGCPAVRAQIFGEARGQTRLGLNGTIIRGIRLPVPPLGVQYAIVERCERVLSQADEVVALIENGLRRIARLRQSLLRLAFEGRLVHQDPRDEPASVLLARIRAERAAASSSPKKKSARSRR